MYKKFFINFIALFILTLVLILISCDFIIKNFDFVISTDNDVLQQCSKYWFDKKMEIAKNKSKEGKKLVFLGGSSVLFGINTNEIEEEFKIPTLNFGIHAAYPYLIFERAKQIINKGDIVIIPMEYSLYSKKSQQEFSDMELCYIFLFEKNIYKSLTIKRKLNCIYFFLNNLLNIHTKKILPKLETRISKDINSEYSIKYWNKNGDIIAPRNHQNEKINNIYSSIKNSSKDFYTKEDVKALKSKSSYLNVFMEFAKRNDVAVYFIYPTILNDPSKYENFHYNLKYLWDQAGYTYFDNFDECFYDKKYFFDTNYHLTSEGASIRTKQIINILRNNSIIHNTN